MKGLKREAELVRVQVRVTGCAARLIMCLLVEPVAGLVQWLTPSDHDLVTNYNYSDSLFLAWGFHKFDPRHKMWPK